ncbi:act minimal PKS acyl carrier protein [Kitasatospora sp. SolWspMP-SS2h]|uniref:acyl carrier protein n=1 Tax=Kitasatospora sp. SolWspMP-SS2h TaxID=1305729 RepID=UPI000DBA418D|nr:acyl carrier protein [Kitasatospora sp. SolWspMP-SS2h]RAJ32097.1 act minimal PKS acyl carrier protein [Kitasatospora sp. SolWspMP-SS2h]
MTATMTVHELHEILIACAGGDRPEVSDDDLADLTLDELGYDSLALIETVARLKVQWGVEIPEGEILEVSTLGDLLDLVHRTAAV